MSTRDQQKAKYWPTAKAYAVLDGTTTEADRRERKAIAEGLDQLRHGWTPAEVVCVLMDAALTIQDLRTDTCDWCDGPVVQPVRDGEEVSWRRGQARVWCSTGCQTLRYDAEIDAAAS
jgi:hypothetical protein